jgi:hypothetical protein
MEGAGLSLLGCPKLVYIIREAVFSCPSQGGDTGFRNNLCKIHAFHLRFNYFAAPANNPALTRDFNTPGARDKTRK